MAFKTPKMDQIGLEYWYSRFLWRLRVDGRFFRQKPILKKGSQTRNQDAACAEACHSPFKMYVWGGMQQNNGE